MFSYEVIQSLNDLELSVYNYIVENSHKIIKMKIKDVANEAHVSTTTILRFCKKLGCDGYSEFKVKFKLYLDKKVENGQKDDLDEIVDSLKKYKNKEFQDKLHNIVDVIRESKGIIWIGLGNSGALGKYGARYFQEQENLV